MQFDLGGLPRVRRRPGALALTIHLVHGVLVATVAWALTVTGMMLVHGGGSGRGELYLALVGALLAFEVGLAIYLVLRRRRMTVLAAEARRALLAEKTAEARHSLIQLLGFLEYRMNPGPVYYGLAVADVLDGEIDRATILLPKAGPHEASLELRALIMLDRGEYSKAARIMGAVMAYSPGRARHWLTLAACLEGDGRHEQARKVLASAEGKFPGAALLREAREALARGASLAEMVLVRAMPGRAERSGGAEAGR